MAIHYRCKRCNHWPFDHKANTQHCPLGKRSNAQFSKDHVYEADPKKPSKEKITI